jgi:hypothetical protein
MSVIVAYILGHYMEILMAILALVGAFLAFINALIVIFLMVPGPEPEASLQKLVNVGQKAIDFLTKFSRK